MSADRLRRAAEVLREAAEGAGDHWFEDADSFASMLGEECPDDEHSMGAAIWITLATPLVGLAMADWLDTMAIFVDSGNDVPGMRGRGYLESVALADRILGDDA